MGTHFGRSRRHPDVHARVPSPTASVTPWPSRLDGDMEAWRLHVAVKTRYASRKALELSRYMRKTAHTNPVIPQVEPVKVDQVMRALSLKATPMHDVDSGKRLFKLQHTC